MREVKFRGKSLKDGRWVYGYLCTDKYINENGTEWLVEPKTVCQYTDFVDRNVVEIWEYDIVNCPESERCGYISWNESKGGFYFNTFSKARGFEEDPMCDYIDEFEVIGNVFDNPELLEKSHADSGQRES